METKIFDNKKIKIREMSKGDLKNVKKFQDFINSLVEENAMIKVNEKQSLREETEWLKEKIKQIKNKKEVVLIAECENKIVGSTHIRLDWGRQEHIGNFGIAIKKGFRKLGLGTYLAKEIIKLAKSWKESKYGSKKIAKEN
jgi:GNAT superfamily N-acetyltransferase